MHIYYLTIAKNDASSDVHIISEDEAKEIVEVLNKGGKVGILNVDEPVKDGQKVVARTINLQGFVSLNKVELVGASENPETMHDDITNLLVNQSVDVTKRTKFKTGTGDWAEKDIKEKRGNRISYYANSQEKATAMYEKVVENIEKQYRTSLSDFNFIKFPVPHISFNCGLEPAFVRFVAFNPKSHVNERRKPYDYSFYDKS